MNSAIGYSEGAEVPEDKTPKNKTYNQIEWISVSDRPLFITTDFSWKCTEDGSKDFIAAVPQDVGWWIHHCVVEDRMGLCVVGDIDNEPAGYDIEDVTHWMPFPQPPK